jgi:ABC-type dipeptide/oligopeptide/nickel transport system permease subunit
MNEEPIGKVRSLWGEAWRQLRRKRVAMVSLATIGVFFLLGGLDFIPAGRRPNTRETVTLVDRVFDRLVGPTNKDHVYYAPGVDGHPLGTDLQGVDVLYKTVKGIKTAIVLGGLTAMIYIPVGLLLGVLAGYFGRAVDDVVVYIYSTLYCIPSILLLVAMMVIMKPGLYKLCLALGVTSWVGLCRLIRGEAFKLRESEYVLAARALGASHRRIILRHIVPNVMHIVIIIFSLGFSGVVLSEAVLTYLGLGVEAGRISWGQMISTAKMELSREPSVWWQFTSAAGALFLLVLAFNIFGDALRDAMDPRLRVGGTK